MTGFGKPKGMSKKKIKPERSKNMTGETLFKNAMNHHAQGDLANAEKGYREAIKIGYYHHDMFKNLGVICKNSGRTDEAVLLYKKAIALKPDEAGAYRNLGNLYLSLGNFEDAIAISNKSLELEPNDSEALLTLGWSQYELGHLDQALASTLKSLELKPDNPTAHMNLGGIYKKLGHLDQALASNLKSLELKPDNVDVLSNLFGVYGEGDLSMLKSMTYRAVDQNQSILNDLSYIEVISSLGEEFTKHIVSIKASTI